MSVIVTIVLLNVERTWAIPVCMFLLPLALTTFGFSISSVESERFSRGAAAAGAGSSFLLLAGFLARLTAGSALADGCPETAGAPSWAAGVASVSRASAGAASVSAFFAFGFSGSGLVSFSGSAIIFTG